MPATPPQHGDIPQRDDGTYAQYTLTDPGNGGTISAEYGGAVLINTSVGPVETRIVDAPRFAGQRLIIIGGVMGFPCGVTVTGNMVLATGGDTAGKALSRAGDALVLQAFESSSGLRWMYEGDPNSFAIQDVGTGNSFSDPIGGSVDLQLAVVGETRLVPRPAFPGQTLTFFVGTLVAGSTAILTFTGGLDLALNNIISVNAADASFTVRGAWIGEVNNVWRVVQNDGGTLG